MLKELIHEIESVLQGTRPPEEELDLHSYVGGHIDDAYDLGFEHGQNRLASNLLEIIRNNT